MKGIRANPFGGQVSTWLVLSLATTVGWGMPIAPAVATAEMRSPRVLAQSSQAGTVLLEEVGRLEPGDATSEAATATLPDLSHPFYWAPFTLIGNGL